MLPMLKEIPLKGRVPGGASLDFVSVQVPIENDRYVPLALIRYSLAGKPQEFGLRFDLDKQTFADHFDDDREKVLQAAIPKIVEIVTEAIRRHTFEKLRKEFVKD
jgi:hypothetical protein